MAALEFFEHECYLKARVPRIKTPDDKIHLMLPEWSGLQNGFTLLFEALIIQLCKSMLVHNVAQLVKTSDHKVWSILDKTRKLSDYSKVTALGMDETSIAKGHKYISLFVDLVARYIFLKNKILLYNRQREELGAISLNILKL